MRQVGELLHVFLCRKLTENGKFDKVLCTHGCGVFVDGYATKFETGNLEWTGEDAHCAQTHGFVTALRIRQLDDFVSQNAETL